MAEERIRGGITVAAATGGPDRAEGPESATTTDRRKAAASPPRRRAAVNYVRPSAAIERGSGFFVPGLEGGKARLAVGTVLLALCFVQQRQLAELGAGADAALAIAALYSCLVLLQSGIEIARDAMRQERSRSLGRAGNDAPMGAESFSCSWAGIDSVQEAASGGTVRTDVDEYKDRVEWSASTYLALTSATRMLLVHKSRVVFDSQLQSTPPRNRDESADWASEERSASATAAALSAVPNPETPTDDVACRSALATLEQSSTGRVALPSSHPAFQFASSGTGSPQRIRTVILQRISSQSCWVVASSDLLAAFTPQDLTWLGRLASYLPS